MVPDNTHLHLHLYKCYNKDYGPCYGFWLFSFERCNGILGKYHANNFSIELWLMRIFSENMTVTSILSRELLDSEHGDVFNNFLSSNNSGSSYETLYGQDYSSSVNHEHVDSHIYFASIRKCITIFRICLQLPNEVTVILQNLKV